MLRAKLPSTTHNWPCKLSQPFLRPRCAALLLELHMQRGCICSAVSTKACFPSKTFTKEYVRDTSERHASCHRKTLTLKRLLAPLGHGS